MKKLRCFRLDTECLIKLFLSFNIWKLIPLSETNVPNFNILFVILLVFSLSNHVSFNLFLSYYILINVFLPCYYPFISFLFPSYYLVTFLLPLRYIIFYYYLSTFWSTFTVSKIYETLLTILFKSCHGPCRKLRPT